MKITIMCTECFHDQEDPGAPEIQNVQMNNDGIFEVICKNGHRVLTVLQMEKFEALFDMGVEAFINGYRTEAVAGMATALERFFEWFTRVIYTKNNIPNNEFDLTWKYLSNSSERQLGAYLLVYLQEFNEQPPQIDSKMVGFRNNVLHKGYIPTDDEVHDYGEYVLQYIREVLNKMNKNHDYKDYFFITLQNQFKLLNEKYKNIRSSTMYIPTVIGLIYDSKIETMNEAMQHIESRNKINTGLNGIPKEAWRFLKNGKMETNN